jgi:hypothetical protein
MGDISGAREIPQELTAALDVEGAFTGMSWQAFVIDLVRRLSALRATCVRSETVGAQFNCRDRTLFGCR